ncbi:MAG: flagellar hook-basal body protein [Anaerolineae bacterium]|nr:flagellar hook-basal body protein [Phycisphaerae bacterium]
MINGLYLSANGVMANSFRQDVIANNLANVENVGFKRDVATFQQRLSEAKIRRDLNVSNPTLDDVSGGMLLSPVSVDLTQGELEPTGNNLDVAIQGNGYFAVQNGDKRSLTRDGRFMVDRAGILTLANGSGAQVLDKDMKPIQLDAQSQVGITIGQFGEITASGQAIAQLGLVDVDDPTKLIKRGSSLISYENAGSLKTAKGSLRSEFVERANVDPATEMSQLMDAQRQLEANANMIKYQDQTLGRLVNDVGKIS